MASSQVMAVEDEAVVAMSSSAVSRMNQNSVDWPNNGKFRLVLPVFIWIIAP